MKKTETISGTKRKIFRLILIITLFMFLFATELVLCAFNYEGNLVRVIKGEVLRKEYYILNPDAPGRYFSGSIASIPHFCDQIIEVQKELSRLRIFALGE